MNPSKKNGPSDLPDQPDAPAEPQPQAEPPAEPQAQKALSRELTEFLIELSIAIHQHGMYPPGHPSLEPAAIQATDRVTYLLKERGKLSFGAARDQLVIEGVASDVDNPLLRELAGRLRRHHLGAISFHQGVSKHEIVEFLMLMAEEPDVTGQPLGLAPRERREQQPNIQMHSVAYDSLRLIDDDGAVDEDQEGQAARTRYAQLWMGLAKAAVLRGGREDQSSGRSSDQDAHGEADEAPRDPAAVARAISEHSESEAYDQMIVGYLLQIVQELRVASGPEAVQLNQRMGDLVAAMEPGALSRLLKMGGDSGQRHQFLVNASRGLKGDSVLRLVEAASHSEEKKVSQPMLRMLGKLAQHADGVPGAQRQHALESIQEQVVDLVTGWSGEDPNPQGYSTALAEMSTAEPDIAMAQVQMAKAEPRRIVDMAFEMDVAGESVTNAVKQLIETEDAFWLLARVNDNKSSALTQSLIGSTQEFGRLLQHMLENEAVDRSTFGMLLELVGESAVEPMMRALVDTESRQFRRLLMDRLVTLQPDAGALAARHLDDPRWYVTRNMLRLISGGEIAPEDFVPDAYLQHEDHRVRYEALRLCTHLGRGREKAVIGGLTDTKKKTVRFALNAALVDCPAAALPYVAPLALSGPTDIRLLAVQVLQTVVGQTARNAFLKITQSTRGLVRRKHPPKDPVYLAALRALYPYRDGRHVRAVLKLAQRRPDPEIAAAARHGSGARATGGWGGWGG